MIGVAADEGSNESVGVGVIAIKDNFPGSLGNEVDFHGVASEGASRFLVGAVGVAGKCGKGSGLFVVENVVK